MKTALKHEFIKCNRAEALKVVGDFISDTRRELMPLTAARVAADYAVAAATIGFVNIAITGTTTESMLARIAIITVGTFAMLITDMAFATMRKNKENELLVLSAFQASILSIEDKKVLMPIDLTDYARDITKFNFLSYKASKDPVNRNLIKASSVFLAITALYYAYQINKHEVNDAFNNVKKSVPAYIRSIESFYAPKSSPKLAKG